MSRTYRKVPPDVVARYNHWINNAERGGDLEYAAHLKRYLWTHTTDKVARRRGSRDPGCHPTGYYGWADDYHKASGKRESRRKLRRYNKGVTLNALAELD